MRRIDQWMTGEIIVRHVTTMSGIRPLGKGMEYRAKGRPDHGLLYLRQGGACFWCDGLPPISLQTGELLYLPKNQRYKMQYTDEKTSFVLVNFTLSDANGEEIMLADGITPIIQGEGSGRIERIMSNLEACETSSGFSSMLRRQELMYRLLGAVYAGDSLLIHEQRYPQIVAGTRLLEQSYLENLPISRFAEESSISLSSFRSLFVKKYGMSPVQYRNRMRLERAERLLAEGTYSVSEVAYACGFENIGYFCRYYKRVIGEAPGETKKRNRDQ